MGRVAAAFGVHGWIKVQPYSESPDALLDYRSWWLREGTGDWQPVTPTEGRLHAGGVIARLATIADRESAQRLAGAEIGVPRAELPALDEGAFYRSDLVGLAVVNRGGADLGRVVAVEDYGAHPVLKVADGAGKRQRLIPWVPAHVDAIDTGTGRIVVDWELDY